LPPFGTLKPREAFCERAMDKATVAARSRQGGLNVKGWNVTLVSIFCGGLEQWYRTHGTH